MDPLGKGMAQMLLDMTISVPTSVAVQCAAAKPAGLHARQAQGPVL
jgi:hypothetical protein